MSGSHKPGITFKATVVSVADNQITFEADSEDIAYFTVGTEFVLHVRLADNGDSNGGDVQTA